MRVTNKVDGDKLARKLATDICRCKKPADIVIEATAKDTKEEAKQSAIGYWTMGWDWDTIETVLEDSEYGDEIISYAMKEAKNYAKEILNKGPFASFYRGQGVALTSGMVGTLEETFQDHLAVYLPNEGVVRVATDHIDVEKTIKLQKAFSLRRQAKAELEKIPEEIEQVQEASVGPVEAALVVIEDLGNKLPNLGYSFSKMYKSAKKDRPNVARFVQCASAIISEERRVLSEAMDKLAEFADVLSSYSGANDEELQVYLSSKFADLADKLEGHMSTIAKNTSRVVAAVGSFTDSTEDLAKVPDWLQTYWEETRRFAGEWDEVGTTIITEGTELAKKLFKNSENIKTARNVKKALQTAGL
jgi:methyl-accepting chemotaxis protein